MSAPITISTRPTTAQVKAILAAGPGATVHHPHSGHRGRRQQLAQALGAAGVPHTLVRTLGWVSRGAAPPVAQVAAAEPEAGDTLVDELVGSD